jgi:hypothetical protein
MVEELAHRAREVVRGAWTVGTWMALLTLGCVVKLGELFGPATSWSTESTREPRDQGAAQRDEDAEEIVPADDAVDAAATLRFVEESLPTPP